MEIDVEISDTQGHLCVDRAELVRVVREALAQEGRRRAGISIALVDQATIQALNRTHLGHDWPTDVLSFGLSDAGDPVLAGELVVSAERAAAQAAELGVPPAHELALYVVHGLLHLCGYDDSNASHAAVMRRREDEILAQLGISNPLHRAGPPEHPAARRGGRAPTRPGGARPTCEPLESSPWSG